MLVSWPICATLRMDWGQHGKKISITINWDKFILDKSEFALIITIKYELIYKSLQFFLKHRNKCWYNFTDKRKLFRLFKTWSYV